MINLKLTEHELGLIQRAVEKMIERYEKLFYGKPDTAATNRFRDRCAEYEALQQLLNKPTGS